ncbi:ERF family protein [Streptococcus sp. 10F2]
MADLTFPELQKKMQLEKEQKQGVKYPFRTAEDIYNKFKALDSGWSVHFPDDDIQIIKDRIYYKATAVVRNDSDGTEVRAIGWANEDDVPILNTQKGPVKQMNSAQWTGAVASYARKYALQGLFAIGDKDVDDIDNENGIDKSSTQSGQQEPQIKYIDNTQYNQILNAIRQMAEIFGSDSDQLINRVADNFRIENFHQVPAEHFGTVMNWIQSQIAKHQGQDNFDSL